MELHNPKECWITIPSKAESLSDQGLALAALCASLYTVLWLSVSSILTWMPSSMWIYTGICPYRNHPAIEIMSIHE
jgi:hypothetical protein